jgi:hypothetical protein
MRRNLGSAYVTRGQMSQAFNVAFWDDHMGAGPTGTTPQQLTGNVPKHKLGDTVVAFLPSLEL